MILQALIFAVAAGLWGFLIKTVGNLRSDYALLWSGFPFGVLLAAYLWFVLGVRSFAKVLVVSFMAEGAFYFATLGPVFVQVIANMTNTHYKSQTQLNMDSLLAGTIAGGLVSVGFLAALPWPRENTRFYLEVLLCAAAGGLFGAAGAIFEDLSSIRFLLPLGGLWQGGMGLVLALVAGLRLEESSADTPSAENA